MKKFLFFLFFGAFSFGINAQNQSTSWLLKGNSRISTSDFLGTTDCKPIVFKTKGVERMRLSVDQALLGIGITTPQAALHLHYQVMDDFSLAYTLENNSFVQIELHNTTGVHIRNFLQVAQQEAGVYYHNFSLSGLSSGLYILVFKNNSKTISSKIIKH